MTNAFDLYIKFFMYVGGFIGSALGGMLAIALAIFIGVALIMTCAYCTSAYIEVMGERRAKNRSDEVKP